MSLWKVAVRSVIFKSELVFKNSSLLSKMPFYAVAKGRAAGIFMSWPDCEAQVKGFPGARYKKFDTVEGAQEFITTNGGSSAASKPKTSKINSNSYNSSSTSNNLKRSYSTVNTSQKKTVSAKPKKESKDKTFENSDYDDRFSDDSDDDLNAMLSKQMDDIEQRLKSFEKGVDKIIKKGTRKSILIEPPQSKKRKTSGGEFEIDDDGFVQVYTDGACSSNGKNSARAGLGVYWGDGHPLNISEPVSGRATNNCGEIQAATRAIKQAIQNGVTKLSINTDSKFVINSVTKWMPGWKRKGWKLQSGEPVKNEVDFKDLDSVLNKLQIKWIYVEAHKGIHGNEMADQLAKAGAARYNK